ncbi:cyclin-like protein [Ilyonectria robusta]|uniref:cyclin-like protein n=1 Tax=Ilyonectria robusta TaxID=1079257 RepID=UPI001E8CEE0D|nr:cyclin-like protein [Ilyonectria robusta]KAH8669251.1 cyclin-like protein [Ilyonectria robusta]
MTNHHQGFTPEEVFSLTSHQRQDIIAEKLSWLIRDEYLEDITQHRRRMENETLPNTSLINTQPDIQWFMRPYLIDFLVEAHAAFSLLPETLFLAVNLLDRYCSKRLVYKQHYQLVGCAALLISAKYSDKKSHVRKIHKLITMCCGLYNVSMFIQMELHVLDTLEWVIGHPTADSFSQLLVEEEGEDQKVEHMAAYLREIALYHRDFVSTKPSIMAEPPSPLHELSLAEPKTLSGHLHNPSPTLARKYSTRNFSRQAAIAYRAMNPTMPHIEHTDKYASDLNSPPQEDHMEARGYVGYPTPP